MSILKIENLTCGYGPARPVLKEVSFSVEEGQFVGVVGPNGSGKTTLLRAIAGLLTIQTGSIVLSQHRIEHLDRREAARRVAFVPQLMEPVEGFSVEELVMLGRTPYFERFSFETEDDHAAVKWALGELKIEGLSRRPVTELSGGEFQRVAIARALAQESKILLLDEPTSHLDFRFSIKVLRMIRRLREEKLIIATFHDLNLAARFSRKLMLINKGEVVAYGKPDAVLTNDNLRHAFKMKMEVRKNPKTGKLRIVNA